ncbi:MAG: heme o synthase [Chloroflexi bacterium]|nr:heme o synthase [Chloroflexota bacterium]
MKTGLRYWLLAALIATFMLIVVGNLVRLSGAGLGCPDWPTCYGQWIAPAGMAAQIQFAHRGLTLVAVLLVGVASILAFTQKSPLWVRLPLAGMVALFSIEILLGASAIFHKDPSYANPVHLGLALASLALVATATVSAFITAADPLRPDRLTFKTAFGKWTLVGLASIFTVMLSGMFLASNAAGPVCTGWPLCGGSLLPQSPLAWIAMGHRILTGFASLVVIGLLILAWKTQRSQRTILPAATATAALFLAEILVGALNPSPGYSLDLAGLHAITSAALWGALVLLVVATGLSGRTEVEELAETGERLDWKLHLRDLVALTKPVIVALLLVTTVAGMVVGGRQLPSLTLTFWTLVGGALAAGGSGALNQYIDRDLDRNMQRTARRPLASGRLTPAEGLAAGLAMCLFAFFVLAWFVNLLAALLSLGGMIYYVLLYSIFLKKATVQNIVIGGGAGAIPPLVGWAAATGSLSMPALFLFGIVFLWTPPHFWALALVQRKDYARAGVPMLPVVKGELATRGQIFIYTLELVGMTLLMPILQLAGSLYLVSALVLGGALIYAAWRVLRMGGNQNAWMMYRYSSMYLALLFTALVLDVFM